MGVETVSKNRKDAYRCKQASILLAISRSQLIRMSSLRPSSEHVFSARIMGIAQADTALDVYPILFSQCSWIRFPPRSKNGKGRTGESGARQDSNGTKITKVVCTCNHSSGPSTMRPDSFPGDGGTRQVELGNTETLLNPRSGPQGCASFGCSRPI